MKKTEHIDREKPNIIDKNININTDLIQDRIKSLTDIAEAVTPGDYINKLS